MPGQLNGNTIVQDDGTVVTTGSMTAQQLLALGEMQAPAQAPSIKMKPAGPRGLAETVMAAVLAGCVVYIVPNETLANWQAVWLCIAVLGLVTALVQSRDARSSG